MGATGEETNAKNLHVYIKKPFVIFELQAAASLCPCQEEDVKPKTQKKVKELEKEVHEPKLQEDDPLSVLTAIIAQVQHAIFLLRLHFV